MVQGTRQGLEAEDRLYRRSRHRTDCVRGKSHLGCLTNLCCVMNDLLTIDPIWLTDGCVRHSHGRRSGHTGQGESDSDDGRLHLERCLKLDSRREKNVEEDDEWFVFGMDHEQEKTYLI